MNSRHLVDPDLLALLDALPALQLSVQLLPEARSAMFPFPADPEAAKAVARIQEQIDFRKQVLPALAQWLGAR